MNKLVSAIAVVYWLKVFTRHSATHFTVMVFLSLLLVLLAVSPIQSLPSGAPSQACSDLRPGPPHGGVPQTTPSPYELDVDMFEDLSSNDGIAVPVTYSYTPGRTYDSK